MLCIEKANLVHYCIERYLALALVYLGVVAVVLPWYCPLSTPHSLGMHSLGSWYVVRASVLVSASWYRDSSNRVWEHEVSTSTWTCYSPESPTR